MRSLQADGWHIDLLRSCKLIFPNDALVPVGLAFNAVLEHVRCLGEQANDFEEPSLCCVFLIPIRRKLHCLANRKFMGGHSIGSIRRKCLDHVVVLGERHLRHLLANYATYYNGVRTHLALDKDAPLHRPAQTVGLIASVTWLGGLHRHYVRMA